MKVQIGLKTYSGENFSLKTLVKICKLLGITLEQFFNGVDTPKVIKRKKK